MPVKPHHSLHYSFVAAVILTLLLQNGNTSPTHNKHNAAEASENSGHNSDVIPSALKFTAVTEMYQTENSTNRNTSTIGEDEAGKLPGSTAEESNILFDVLTVSVVIFIVISALCCCNRQGIPHFIAERFRLNTLPAERRS